MVEHLKQTLNTARRNWREAQEYDDGSDIRRSVVQTAEKLMDAISAALEAAKNYEHAKDQTE